MRDQLSLLDAARQLPEGFRYEPNLITTAEEDVLVRHVRELPFKNFEFHGHVGKRRVVFYGWRYDFNQGGLREADEIPSFLLPLRELAGSFAGMPAGQLQQVLVTEYEAGATIGWHRDKAVFGDVIGISLLIPAVDALRYSITFRSMRLPS